MMFAFIFASIMFTVCTIVFVSDIKKGDYDLNMYIAVLVPTVPLVLFLIGLTKSPILRFHKFMMQNPEDLIKFRIKLERK